LLREGESAGAHISPFLVPEVRDDGALCAPAFDGEN
jgi:hypothetical protein